MDLVDTVEAVALPIIVVVAVVEDLVAMAVSLEAAEVEPMEAGPMGAVVAAMAVEVLGEATTAVMVLAEARPVPTYVQSTGNVIRTCRKW